MYLPFSSCTSQHQDYLRFPSGNLFRSHQSHSGNILCCSGIHARSSPEMDFLHVTPLLRGMSSGCPAYRNSVHSSQGSHDGGPSKDQHSADNDVGQEAEEEEDQMCYIPPAGVHDL